MLATSIVAQLAARGVAWFVLVTAAYASIGGLVHGSAIAPRMAWRKLAT